MNILVLSKNFKYTSAMYYFHFLDKIKKYENTIYHGEGYDLKGDIKTIIEKNNIDCIIDNDTKGELSLILDSDKFKFFKGKKVLLLGDQHRTKFANTPEKIIDKINDSNIDIVFMRCDDGTSFKNGIYSKNLKSKIFFLPWSIDENYFGFQSNNKTIDICMLGSVSESVYPLRNIISKDINVFGERHNLRYIKGKRSGVSKNDIGYMKKYNNNPNAQKTEILGKRYVETLNKSKLLLTDSSIFGYPVKKYFEGMATGCMVMGDNPNHVSYLKLKNGFNFVLINKNNWKEKVLYYLKNGDKRKEIINNARQTILSHHTDDIRIKEMLDKIKNHE